MIVTGRAGGHGLFWLNLAIIGLCGCQNPHRTHLIASNEFYEADVPLPGGFKKIEQGSEDMSTGQQRLYLRHSYKGKGEPYTVRDFYLQQMPTFGWAKTSSGSIHGNYTLRFSKGDEACTVLVTDGGWGTTEVQVKVNQEQRGDQPPVAARGDEPAAPRKKTTKNETRTTARTEDQ